MSPVGTRPAVRKGTERRWMIGDGMRLRFSAWRRARPRLEPRPSPPERFLLDQRPDPAVALVIGICALGEIAFAHLREVVRGVGEFEQRLEACEIRGKLTLPVLRYCAELVRVRGGDMVQTSGV